MDDQKLSTPHHAVSDAPITVLREPRPATRKDSDLLSVREAQRLCDAYAARTTATLEVRVEARIAELLTLLEAVRTDIIALHSATHSTNNHLQTCFARLQHVQAYLAAHTLRARLHRVVVRVRYGLTRGWAIGRRLWHALRARLARTPRPPTGDQTELPLR